MSAYVSTPLRRLVRERFDGRCAYCQTAEEFTATQFEIEHVDPRANGGQTEFENLCLACPMCNRFKAHLTSAVDPETAKVAPLFHPHQQSWSDHFAWSGDAAEIVGLSAIGRATVAALRMNRPAVVRARRMWAILGEHPPAS
jgi:predicted DCC family thiol-disulfide oxidoreductase YuxK